MDKKNNIKLKIIPNKLNKEKVSQKVNKGVVSNKTNNINKNSVPDNVSEEEILKNIHNMEKGSSNVNNKRRNMIYIIIFGILLLSILFSASYAYFSVDTTNTNKLGNIIGNIDCVGVVYSESDTISLENNYPVTDEYALANYTPVTVTVTNNCSASTFYYLTFSSLANNTGYIPDNKINIAADKKTGNESFYRVINTKFVSYLTEIPSADTLNTVLTNDLNRRNETKNFTNKTNYVLDADYLASGVTRTYRVYLWVDYYEGDVTETGLNNNTTQGLDYKASIGVVPDRTPSAAKKIEADYNNSVTGISKYTNAVTDECAANNCTTVNNARNVYYITSNSINNIIFEGFCWKMIRTTENGGVKLLYNGLPSNGTCTASGTNTMLTAAQMNTSSSAISYRGVCVKPAYVGYMYNPDTLNGTYGQQLRGDSTYDVNTEDSPLKEKTEYWFSHSNIDETKLEDVVFCNDRSLASSSPVTEANLASVTSGNVYFANYGANKTTLDCSLITDSFNKANIKAQTNYKVGFMTTPEAKLITSTVYNNSSYYWLGSPGGFINTYASVHRVYSSDVYALTLENIGGVRPVITMNSTVAITDGLGSTTSPYTTN